MPSDTVDGNGLLGSTGNYPVFCGCANYCGLEQRIGERVPHFSAASVAVSSWCCDSSFSVSSLSALRAASDAGVPLSISSASRLALLGMLSLLLLLPSYITVR